MRDNNDLTRRLIKESEFLTANDFTNQIMTKINKINKPIIIPSWQLYVFVFSLIFISGTMVFYFRELAKTFSLIKIDFYLPPMSLEISLVVFVLLAINKFIILKKEAQKIVAQH